MGVHAAFDERWHRRVLAGDGPAVAQLPEIALAPLYRFCFYRVDRNRHLCEEVVQQTLLTAIERIEQYEPSRSGNEIFGWLTGLARNEIQRVMTLRERTTSLNEMWLNMDRDLVEVFGRIDATTLGTDVLERDETRQMVNAAMSQLPTSYREALEAKYVNGDTVRDMATRWATSEKAVESRLTRAREAFRETFLALTRNLDVEAML
ncbi:MAG: sigma-70 family RNA polymerase sigma factor [Planctomycetes bacterium]|nr:sigma-70 family RNA polymerase sigma factor [Planctomycetota bacterium]